jgi:Peptidase inhibitor family I36
MDFRLRTLTLASAIGALGFASVVTPVHSSEKGVNGRHAVNANENRHCVTDLSKPDASTTCYDTFTAAIAAATRGGITDAPADSRVAMNDANFVAKVYNTSDKRKENLQAEDKKKEDIRPRVFGVRGTIFYKRDFGGSSATWSGQTCDDQVDPETGQEHVDGKVAYVGDDWNDDFESARGGNNCQMKVWEHRDFRGASSPWFWDEPWLGVLQDEGSSVQFR